MSILPPKLNSTSKLPLLSLASKLKLYFLPAISKVVFILPASSVFQLNFFLSLLESIFKSLEALTSWVLDLTSRRDIPSWTALTFWGASSAK